MDRTVFKGYNYPSESQLPQPKLPEAPPPPPLNNSIFIDQQRQPPAPLQARNNENQFEKLNPQQGVVPQYHLPPPQLGSYSQNIYYIPLNEIEPKQGNYYYPPNNSQCHHIEMSPSFHYTNTSYVLLFDLILSVVNVVMFLTIILPCYLVTLPDKLKAIPQIQRIKCQTCKTILTEQSINLFNEPPYFYGGAILYDILSLLREYYSNYYGCPEQHTFLIGLTQLPSTYTES